MERVNALIAMLEVRITAMLGLHLEAAGQDLGVPRGIVVERPWSFAYVEDKLVIFANGDFRGHFLFDPLVEADALEIV